MYLSVASNGLCQRERGADALVLVFVIEDGEGNAIHRGSIREDAHWPGAASDFAEASFNGVGRADGFALGQGFVAPAGQQLVEIVAQTGDGPGIIGRPAVGETARRRTRPRQGGRIHDGVQTDLYRWPVTNSHLAQDIADLVHVMPTSA